MSRFSLIFLLVVSCQFVGIACYSSVLALELGYMSAVAYEQATSINSWSCNPCKKYHMESPSAFYNASGNIQGFTAYSPSLKAIVVTFRGSQDIKNWIINLSVGFSNYEGCADCKVHSGFYSGYKQVSAIMKEHITALMRIHPTARIITTGHSLGGALAILAAIDIQKTYKNLDSVITFGCPRVGNANFAAFATHFVKGYRIIHYDDIVPHNPPSNFGFRHGVEEVWYQKGMQSFQLCTAQSAQCANSLSITSFSVDDHDLSKYLQLKVQQLRQDEESAKNKQEEEISKSALAVEQVSEQYQKIELQMVQDIIDMLEAQLRVQQQ